MSARDDGGPAFPLQSIGPDFAPGYAGMTLRDWFAGQALAGLAYMNTEHMPGIVKRAYQLADAMLAERVKERGR